MYIIHPWSLQIDQTYCGAHAHAVYFIQKSNDQTVEIPQIKDQNPKDERINQGTSVQSSF